MKVGIDEAGRGPVLGPLVIAGMAVPMDEAETLKAIGVKDSKQVSPAKRDDLFEHLIAHYSYRAVYVSAVQIDDALTKPSSSLNNVEHSVMSDLIDCFDAERYFIDAPASNNPFDDEQILYESGADETYPVVGGASIIAKVLRDKAMRRIETSVGKDLGSGYPSDPVTKSYLETADLTADWIRQSWQTVQELKAKRAQQTLIGVGDKQR